MTTEIHLPLLLAAMGLVAALYASVGHGGASGYLAIMAMAAFPAAARQLGITERIMGLRVKKHGLDPASFRV